MVKAFCTPVSGQGGSLWTLTQKSTFPNEFGGEMRATDKVSLFKKEDNGFVTDPFDIANEFNDFFVNIGPKLAERIHSSGKDYFEYLKEPVQKTCL